MTRSVASHTGVALPTSPPCTFRLLSFHAHKLPWGHQLHYHTSFLLIRLQFSSWHHHLVKWYYVYLFIVCLSLHVHPLAPGPSMHSLQVQPLCTLFRNRPLPFIPYETLQGPVATEQPKSVNLHLRAAAGAATATRPLGGTMWKRMSLPGLGTFSMLSCVLK